MKDMDTLERKGETDAIAAILDSCDRIAGYTSGMTREGFLMDMCVRDACAFNCQVIGDRMGRLSDGIWDGDVDRDSVVGFGRMLDETYGTKLFDDASLWDFITDTVPKVLDGCRRILEGTGRNC